MILSFCEQASGRTLHVVPGTCVVLLMMRGCQNPVLGQIDQQKEWVFVCLLIKILTNLLTYTTEGTRMTGALPPPS